MACKSMQTYRPEYDDVHFDVRSLPRQSATKQNKNNLRISEQNLFQF